MSDFTHLNRTTNVEPLPATGRVLRRPAHPFYIAARPFQIVPFFMAPVLPGETMRNLLFQARGISQPIKSSITGWWVEYFFFYVKLRDMPKRTTWMDMLINPEFDPTSHVNASPDVAHYTHTGQINFSLQCYERVVTEYFRHENEQAAGWNSPSYMLGSYALASVNRTSALDSAVMKQYTTGHTDVDLSATGPTGVTTSEVAKALANWKHLQASGMGEQAYENYLATFGITVPEDEPHIPELVRYVKEWAYPTNTVDPATGVPNTALSFSNQERADKDRFFREPGFLYGVFVARPKIYYANQKGSVANSMSNWKFWLPAVLGEDPVTSVMEFAGTAGPVPNASAAYYIDARDTFIYGDQFMNAANTNASGTSAVNLPGALMDKRYISSADADSFFKEATKNWINVDGNVQLAIAGRQVDYSATV